MVAVLWCTLFLRHLCASFLECHHGTPWNHVTTNPVLGIISVSTLYLQYDKVSYFKLPPYFRYILKHHTITGLIVPK